MKILAIRLKNLTSIEGAVEVDFAMEQEYLRFQVLRELANLLY